MKQTYLERILEFIRSDLIIWLITVIITACLSAALTLTIHKITTGCKHIHWMHPKNTYIEDVW